MALSGAAQPIFFYDLASPECYLVAEELLGSGQIPEFEPVLASDLKDSVADVDRESIERRARELGLQPVRWPRRWPPDPRPAMLAATYAKRIGRGVAFSAAAFRQAFAGGRDLSEEATVLIAGAACEMHPTALLKGIALRSTAQALAEAGARARAHGVRRLPAVVRPRVGAPCGTAE
jgi:2-hydroxychromene-2-carboxylate isomerase